MSISNDREHARSLYRWLSLELATALTWRIGNDLRPLVPPVKSPGKRNDEVADWLNKKLRRQLEIRFSPSELECLLCDLWRIDALPIGCEQVASVIAWLDGPTDVPCGFLRSLPDILTSVGAEAIREEFAISLRKVEAIMDDGALIPEWNRTTGMLSFKGKSADVDLSKATGVCKVLDGFQAEGWPERVESPFGNAIGTDLADLVKSLNRIADRGQLPLKFGRRNAGFRWQEI